MSIKQKANSVDLRKIIIDLKFSIIQDKRVYNNLSLSEKVRLKRFVKITKNS